MARGSKSKRKQKLAVGLMAVVAVLFALAVALMPERREPREEPGPERRPPVTDDRTAPDRPAEDRPADERSTEARPTGREGAAAAPEGAPRPAPPPAARPEAPPPVRLAVVIDDAGHNLRDLEPFLSFPAPLTIAVLPYLARSREAAEAARAAGKAVLLHSPMEPLNGENPGPGAITTALSAEEIRSLLEDQFSQVPGALGMNNHMGSRATADERVMGEVMAWLNGKGKFFLDSRTTAGTVAEPAAGRHQVAFLKRDVFMDNSRDPQEIRREILRGVEIGRRNGTAVLIGHVTSPATIEVLRELLPELERDGVRLIRLEDLFL